MRKQRAFSPDFKRQVVEELLSGVSTPAQAARRYEVSSGLLYHWKKQYAKGGFGNDASKEAVQEERVRRLEQMLGKAYLEIEFLKKHCISDGFNPNCPIPGVHSKLFGG